MPPREHPREITTSGPVGAHGREHPVTPTASGEAATSYPTTSGDPVGVAPADLPPPRRPATLEQQLAHSARVGEPPTVAPSAGGAPKVAEAPPRPPLPAARQDAAALHYAEDGPHRVVAGALYDFCGYLTTRPTAMTVGS